MQKKKSWSSEKKKAKGGLPIAKTQRQADQVQNNQRKSSKKLKGGSPNTKKSKRLANCKNQSETGQVQKAKGGWSSAKNQKEAGQVQKIQEEAGQV